MGAVQNYVTVPRRQPDVGDYIEMSRRYRSWIVAPMFIGLVLSVVIGCMVPNTYVSSATLQITPQQVPTNLVPSAINLRLTERLNEMSIDILGRNSLIEIITSPALDLYPRERASMPLDDVAEMMKTQVKLSSLQVASVGGRRYDSAFTISFSYTDRWKAQQVVRTIVSKFTESNTRVQKNQASLTSNFLAEEVRAAKERVDQIQADITKFRQQNAGRLPEQDMANAQQLSVLQMSQMNNTQNMNRVQKEKLELETQLATTKQKIRMAQDNVETTVQQGGTSPEFRNDAMLDMQRVLTTEESKLAAMKQQKGANHPTVQTQQVVVNNLRKQLKDLEASSAATPAPTQAQPETIKVRNPKVEAEIVALTGDQRMIETRLEGLKTDMDLYAKEAARFESEMREAQSRMLAAPLNAQQYQTMLSDLNLAKQAWEEKAHKYSTSETAQNLEDSAMGESLKMVEPASLPDTPTSPKRGVWAGLGLLCGLGMGIMLAAAKEVKDTSLKNLKDVRAYTNLPVLSSIPLLENALLVRRKRRLAWTAWTCGVIFGSALMAIAIYYRYTVA